jgi:hypothetical protein
MDALLASIDDAESLPGEEARAAEHELLRQEMLPLNEQCLNFWQRLKRYIAKLYPDSPDSQKTAWAAAGWNHYDNNDAWVETQALMSMGSQYIAEHKTELLANDNMPAGFEAAFNAQSDLFNTKYSTFIQAKESAVVGTDEKIDANNDIYARTIVICLDGQAIYDGNETLKGQFSFEKVSDLVSPPGASAVKFFLINTATGLPINGAEIKLKNSTRLVTTDENGYAEMTQLASGDAVFTITADGMTDKSLTMTLTGTTKSEHVNMEPLFAGEMNVGSEQPETVGSNQ